MSVDFSRRQSLKIMGGIGLFSAMPLGVVSASESKHAYVIVSQESTADDFGQFVNETMDTNTIQINHKNYESIMSISHIPKGALLIGLVNEAEKVLIDVLVQERRGIITTTARVSPNYSNEMIPGLAEMTIKAAFYNPGDINIGEVQNPELSTGSLISFYAYL